MYFVMRKQGFHTGNQLNENLTSKPDPEPSRVPWRECVAVLHTFICPSKLPQANNFPSELKATVLTVSLCPVFRKTVL